VKEAFSIASAKYGLTGNHDDNNDSNDDNDDAIMMMQ